MKNISDIIEEFILNQFLEDDEINLSRNELALFFNCAPSQINYVLQTRFTPIRGFVTTSKRGGGGFIKVFKHTNDNELNYVQNLINDVIGDEIDFNSSIHLLDNLKSKLLINQREYNIIKVCISNKSLASPVKTESRTRANVLKNLLLEIIKQDETIENLEG